MIVIPPQGKEKHKEFKEHRLNSAWGPGDIFSVPRREIISIFGKSLQNYHRFAACLIPPKTHLAVLDPEKKSLNGLFSLLNYI